MKSIRNVIVVLIFFIQVCHGDVFSQNKGFGDNNVVRHRLEAGLPSMRQMEGLPFLYQNGTQTRQFCSYNPTGADNDGLFTTAYTKYIDDNGEFVIFDASGPGCLYRQQYNIWYDGRFPEVGKTHIKYYFDNEPIAQIDVPINDLFAGKISPFIEPYAFLDSLFRFGVLYYPLTFKKRLKITTTYDLNKVSKDYKIYPAAWYQFTYLTYANDTSLQSWTNTHSNDYDDVIKQWENTGVDPKPETDNIKVSKSVRLFEATRTNVLELKGEGSISSLKIYLKPYNRDVFYRTHLRIYWDGSPVASVDMPLANFFGGGGETYENCQDIYKKTLKTLMYGYNGESHEFYSYWPMPYWKSARFELWNDSQTVLDSLRLDVEYKPGTSYNYPKDKSGYFCAKRTVSQDKGGGIFAPTFQESGRGHVVGLSFYSKNYSMGGDEFVYIDDSHTPQIHGDGTEDDHNQGWGGSAYQKPLWGGLLNGYQGSYRLYLNDSYIFNKNIKIQYEYSYSGGNDYGGEVDAVVYYYKSFQPENLHLTDEIDVGSSKSEKAHSYILSGKTWGKTIYAGYDGYERDYEYDMMRDNGYGYQGSCELVATIAPDNNGVKLRRRIYRTNNGMQLANVYVDGVKVKERPWDIVTFSSAPWYQGWYDTDFEIPASYTSGKRSIRLKVEYLKGGSKSEINEFYYWVFSYSNGVNPFQKTQIKELRAQPKENEGINLNWVIDQKHSLNSYYWVYRSLTPEFFDPVLVGSSNTETFTDKYVKPGTKYYYRIATEHSTVECSPQTATVETKEPQGMTTASLLSTDTVTTADGADKYGSEGFIKFNYRRKRVHHVLPDYISYIDYGDMNVSDGSLKHPSISSSIWTGLVNARFGNLGKLVTENDRIITLYVNDKKQHQLALYFSNSNKEVSKQKIEILDLNENVISPEVRLMNFEKGEWLVYKFSGSIRIRITNLDNQSTALIPAIFFGKKQ